MVSQPSAVFSSPLAIGATGSFAPAPGGGGGELQLRVLVADDKLLEKRFTDDELLDFEQKRWQAKEELDDDRNTATRRTKTKLSSGTLGSDFPLTITTAPAKPLSR